MAAIPQVGAAGPVFALTPALVDAGVIDYSTAEGRRLYLAATKALADDTEGQYDGSSERLSSFLHKLKIRAIEFGWIDQGVLDINITPGADDPTLVNLLDKYGDVTIEQVRQHVLLYSGVQNRAAQDCVQVFNCVMKSLTHEAINKIKHKQNEYTINGTPSGVMLIKLIVKEAHIDTNATLTRIRNEISNLDEYMIKIEYDVSKFNLHVQELMSQLSSRGAESNELLNNLFKAYSVCNDENFVRYIESRQNNYDDGADITAQELMDSANNKYQVRVDNGEWNSPSRAQSQIIALKAEVTRLKTGKTPKKGKNKVKKAKGSSKSNAPKPTNKKPDWMLKKPTAEEKRTGNKKTVNDKEYYWCPNHQAWGRHKPSECRGLNYRRPNNDNNGAQPTTNELVQNEVQINSNSETPDDEAEYQSE